MQGRFGRALNRCARSARHAFAKDSSVMLLVYSAVCGLALLGLWWLGWMG